MQTKTFFSCCLAAVLLGTTSSCEKTGPDPVDLTKTEILTTGQWKMSAYILTPPVDIDGDGTLDSDAYALLMPCVKDNYMILKKGGEMETNEGPTKCNDGDPQIKTSTWALSNNDTEITIDGMQGTIQELTSSQLRVKTSVAGNPAEMTFVR